MTRGVFDRCLWAAYLRWRSNGASRPADGRVHILDTDEYMALLPAVPEREYGQELQECAGCRAYREGVRLVVDNGVPLDLCTACRGA